jgi:hypothetical protein
MKRIRSLGFVILSMAGLAAIPASASAAGAFVAGEYPATLQGAHTLIVRAGAAEKACYPNGKATLSKQSETVSLIESPLCQTGSLNMNGCEFMLRPGSKSIDIAPAGCGPISTSLAGNLCPITIGAQVGLPATYSNFGTGEGAGVSISLQAKNVKYTAQSTVCGKEKGKTYEDLELLTEGWNETAKNAGGKAIGLSAYAKGDPVGLFMAPRVFAEGEAVLTAQAFPVNVTGGLGGKPSRLFYAESGSTEVECKGAGLDVGTLSNPRNFFSMFATYSGCNAAPFGGSPIYTNSCFYHFAELTKTGSEYLGEPSIKCISGGDAIAIEAPGCKIRIPAQSLTSAKFTNEGSGASGSVKIRLTAKKIQYTTPGGFICSLGGLKASGSDGAIDIYFTLKGTFAG